MTRICLSNTSRKVSWTCCALESHENKHEPSSVTMLPLGGALEWQLRSRTNYWSARYLVPEIVDEVQLPRLGRVVQEQLRLHVA